ncbi:MAG: phosphoglycolate phosphatase [Betaproteobacteria bacterium]|nr:phosphoglycolate phosphatase [Betaproteobacteria bacterium]
MKSFPLPIKAVVIDLDGTLLDTASDLAHAAELMMAELGLPCPSLETISTYIGNGVSRLVKRVLTGDMDAEPDAALFEKAIASYNRHYSANVSLHSRPFEGVVEGLQAFKAMGLHVACITNKAEVFTHPLLKDTGLFDYFELILSGDTLPKRKPDPLPLLHACEVFKVKPAELLLIGDSLNDTQAARAAGSPVFCVPYGYNRGRPVAELDLDAVVPSLAVAARMVTKA